jgi:hypothetical protein
VTVIAANLKEMAADTMVGIEGQRHCYSTKIFRLDDGSIIGGAGESPGLDLVMDWLKRGEIKGNEPDLLEIDTDKLDVTVLRLRDDGLWLYADTCVPFRLKDSNYAIGCGADLALYVMRELKKSPMLACKAAAKYVEGCGGSIDVLRL